MSRFHFIRQFKSVFGETPVEFRTRSRLERAKHLLAHGEESVTAVCMAVGFSSLGSFSALFARRFGQPPSTYRKQRAGESAPDCMTLLRRSWERTAQFSRSERPSDQDNTPTSNVSGKPHENQTDQHLCR